MAVNIWTYGSSTYFDALNSSVCQMDEALDGHGDRLCAGGSFQTNFSKTYQVEAAGGFNLTEGNDVIAAGDLATDVIQIGKVELANMRFGVAYDNLDPAGNIGLGYGLNDGTATDSPYRSFLEELQAAGAIKSKLYSLFLNTSGR